MTTASLTVPQVADSPARSNFLLPALSLGQRELVRFIRQRHRVIGAFATPIVFWLLIGGGMGGSFHEEGSNGAGYMNYFFPGTILMILLFTAIFSTISIIEDRREGFLQSVLVAPIPRMSIVMGKVLGGTTLAFGQGLIFLLLAPTVHIHLTLLSFLQAALFMLIVSFALTALGFCIAWRMTSSQGFHAIMNLFLMPMWFLSGALFPISGAWVGLKIVMLLNPLTYGLAGIRESLIRSHEAGLWATLPMDLLVSVAFAGVLFFLASWIARGRTAADLQ
jgi:ABC-2 type transport system permease protein